MVTVSAADTNDTVIDVQTTFDDVNGISAPSNSQTVNDNINDEEILASNNYIAEEENSDVLKTSNSGTFKDLQNLIDKTGDAGKIELSNDYVANKKSISIEKSISIDGKGHTLDAKNLDRILDIDISKSKTVLLSNIKFINGEVGSGDGGAIRIDGGNVIIKNCTFEDNYAGNNIDDKGGAIYSKNSRLEVYDSTFKLNRILRVNDNTYGGAIAVSGGSCIVDACYFRSNSAVYGGAIWSNGKMTIKSSNFEANYAKYNGGAIYIKSNLNNIESNTFNGNYVNTYNGGAIYVDGENNILKNNSFQSNKAYLGGAIYIKGKGTLVDNCKFIDNAKFSFAVYCTAKDCRIENSYFASNSYKNKILNIHSDEELTAENCWFGNGRYSTPTGNEGKVIVKRWRYLDVLDFSKGDTISEMENLSVAFSKEGYFEPVFVCKDTNEISKVDDSFKLSLVKRDIKYPLSYNGDSKLIRDGDIVKISYAPLSNLEGSVVLNLLSQKLEYIVKHEEGSTYTDLRNLIKNSKGKINLTHDYAYSDFTDSSLKAGIPVSTLVIEGNGHTIDAKKNSVFSLNGGKLTLKNLNLINCGNSIRDAGDVELINCTISKARNAINIVGDVVLINSTIEDVSSNAINLGKNILKQSPGNVVLHNSKIIKAKTGVGGYANAYIYDSIFSDVNKGISNNDGDVTVEGSEFSGGIAISSNGEVKVNKSTFSKIDGLYYSLIGHKFVGSVEVKIQNSLIKDSKPKNPLFDTYKNDLEVSNCTFINIAGSNKPIIQLDITSGSLHDCIFENNKGTVVGEDDADTQNKFTVNNNIFLSSSKKDILIGNAEYLSVTKNWFGNTINNKDELLIKDKNVNNWMLLDVHYNDDETAIIIELDELYNKDNKKITFTDGLNTMFNVSVKNNIKEVTLENGKGFVDIEDVTDPTLTVDVYYNSHKFTFVLNRTIYPNNVTVHNYDELASALENAQKLPFSNYIINLANGDYRATKNIVLTDSAGVKNLVINGNNNVLDGKDAYSFLWIQGLSNSIDGLELTIRDATFKNFHSEDDGSVLDMLMGYGKATLDHVNFIENTAGNGGAVALSGLTGADIKKCEFTKNSARYYGGAVYANVQNNLGIKDTTFSQNRAKNLGGAVYDSSKTTTIDNSKFLDNTARRGGALYYASGTVTCTGSEFLRNVAIEDAGAVYRNGPFYDYNNVFRDNSPDNFEYTGSDEEDDTDSPSYSGDSRYSGSSTGYGSIGKITVGNHQISISNNMLTLGVLNQIFNKDFRNGHLLVYIDGILVFNATTTDDLTQIIIDLLSLLLGKHEIKVVFTDGNGNTNNYTENITI